MEWFVFESRVGEIADPKKKEKKKSIGRVYERFAMKKAAKTAVSKTIFEIPREIRKGRSTEHTRVRPNTHEYPS